MPTLTGLGEIGYCFSVKISAFAVTLFLMFVLVGCKGDAASEKTDEIAEICQRTTERMKSGKSTDIMLDSQTALKSCSVSCDKGSKASCANLQTHIDILCKTDKSMCTKLCAAVKSPSLKKATCAVK